VSADRPIDDFRKLPIDSSIHPKLLIEAKACAKPGVDVDAACRAFLRHLANKSRSTRRVALI